MEAVPEYRTGDGTRIDVAVLKDGEKLLAIELENSYKWIRQRIVYNIVKASRAGFPELWIVYPFQAPSLGWIEEYAEELDVSISILKPEELKRALACF
nr:hypothetical protein [Thermococcus sp. 21S7]